MTDEEIRYSEKFSDDTHEYRQVELPLSIAWALAPGVLLSEDEWRGLGIIMSLGWIHCGSHSNTPHVLWFRRPLNPVPPSPYQVSASIAQRPRMTRSNGDVPRVKQSTKSEASSDVVMRRLVRPNALGFGTPRKGLSLSTELPMVHLTLRDKPALNQRHVTARDRLQTKELFRY